MVIRVKTKPEVDEKMLQSIKSLFPEVFIFLNQSK
jgi:hypothetical protein